MTQVSVDVDVSRSSAIVGSETARIVIVKPVANRP